MGLVADLDVAMLGRAGLGRVRFLNGISDGLVHALVERLDQGRSTIGGQFDAARDFAKES